MDDNRENVDEEQEKNNVQKNSKLSNEIKKRIAKSSKTNAAKKGLAKAIMPILPYVLIIILIIIVVIGIVMFFLTMPGMVMDQIKEFARKVGNSVASWFGADTTRQVEDVDIYETLNYLENMGYDLKGYGFLTDYVGEADDGVKRDDEDNIEEAKSDFIASYLVSDNYVYTIKNFNMTNDNWFTGLCAHLASLFTGGNSNQYWSRGMIDIWLDGGTLGKEDDYYSVYDSGSIEIDADKKTMEIKRGWFNNSMTYNLDGWTGRYGMPIDFLLSIHLATMMPDLAYDMSTGFETIIKLLLHPVDGGEEDENTAIGYYKIGDKYISYDDFEECASSGVTGSFNSWRISKKEAMTIMKKFGIKSPDNCVGTADLDDKEVSKDRMAKNVKDDSGKTDIVEFYNSMIDKMAEYGYNSSDIKKISNFSEFVAMLEDTDYDKGDGTLVINNFDIHKGLSKTVNWIGDFEGNSTNFYSEVKISYMVGTQIDNVTPMTIEYNDATIEYKISREVSSAEIQEWLEENEISNPEEARCSNLDKEECCSVCRRYIQSIYDKMKKVDVSNLKIYQPYISRVVDHWYRDVYFVTADSSARFVDYDYDYEAITKERWTRYETYDDMNSENYGEYKLYKTDGSLYSGTQEEADEEGIKVTKKAITKKIGDMASDLEWNDINGVLSAYDLDSQTQQELSQVYPESEDPIDQNVYVNTRTTGNVIQTGEGQRTETNSKIKKMFLENTYFRYDGSKETAEIITSLRKKINNDENYYGTIKGTHLNLDGDVEEVDYISNGLKTTINGKTYDAKDFSGQVSLNQDSLNAFSMLENEHTLDSDYIYRDFKELVVELGYFEKEELTDETPRLLQWIIPEIGSNGFPNRALDKKEHEYGTMVHSKGDIDANKKNTIMARLQEFLENETESDNEENISANSQSLTPVSGITDISMKSAITNNLVGALSGDKDPSQVSVDEFLEAAAEIHSSMEGNFWEYCAAGDHSGTATRHTSDGSCPGNYATFEAANSNGKTADCSSYVSWVLQKVGIITAKYTSQEMYTELAEYILTKEEAGELKPGDILLSEGHVQINGENNMQYNAGSTSAIQGPPKEEIPSFYTHVIRLPFSGSSNNASAYEGYQGNEAVVSPVTGILLEYGTYTEEDIDSITGEQYRVNVDLKYGTSNQSLSQSDNQNSDNNSNNGSNSGTGNKSNNGSDNSSNSDARIVHDKVGYAKILVLDKENYTKLEALLKSKTQWKDTTLLTSNGNYKDIDITEESTKEWNDAENTLYGYKEFAEMYEKAGIAGNVVYIDGFKCEMPDENFDTENANTTKEIPNGEEIKLKDFEEITKNSFDSNGKLNISDEAILNTLYEKDEEYKMASKKATEKLNTENDVKSKAALSVYDETNKLIFIKEGTTLGRTITDRELIQEYRNEQYGDYRKDENSPEDFEEKVIGNYINIIMRDTDKTVVENVEDYMKLDDGTVKHTENDWELFFWLPFESGAADTKPSYIEGRFTGPVCVSSCSSGEVGIGIVQETSLTSSGMCNQRDQFIPFMKENYPQFYSILSFLDGKDANYYWNDYNGGNAVQAALQKCDELDHDEFLSAQMEEAKEHYLKGLLESKPWLEERPSCVQGAVLHLRLWGASTDGIEEGMSDEEIISKVRHTIANTNSTAGNASGDETTGRAFSEPEIAFGILDGRLSEEDVEQWVRTNDTSILKEKGVEYRGP